MQQHPGFEDTIHSHFACKLNKAIYGLKQTPRASFDTLATTLVLMGFSKSQAYSSLFIKTSLTSQIFLRIYVDDKE